MFIIDFSIKLVLMISVSEYFLEEYFLLQNCKIKENHYTSIYYIILTR